MDKVYLLFGTTDEGFTDVIDVFIDEIFANTRKALIISDESEEGYDKGNIWVEARSVIK